MISALSLASPSPPLLPGLALEMGLSLPTSQISYQGLPSVYPAWKHLTLVSPFYSHGAVLVQAFIISSVDHCHCSSTDPLSLDHNVCGLNGYSFIHPSDS